MVEASQKKKTPGRKIQKKTFLRIITISLSNKVVDDNNEDDNNNNNIKRTKIVGMKKATELKPVRVLWVGSFSFSC